MAENRMVAHGRWGKFWVWEMDGIITYFLKERTEMETKEEKQAMAIHGIQNQLEDLSNYYGEFGDAHDLPTTPQSLAINQHMERLLERVLANYMKELLELKDESK